MQVSWSPVQSSLVTERTGTQGCLCAPGPVSRKWFMLQPFYDFVWFMLFKSIWLSIYALWVLAEVCSLFALDISTIFFATNTPNLLKKNDSESLSKKLDTAFKVHSVVSSMRLMIALLETFKCKKQHLGLNIIHAVCYLVYSCFNLYCHKMN